MDSNQLNCYAKILKIADFLGVYASDELSSIPTLETGMLIFNTDPSKKSGEHWIGLCINKEYIFYFDSLHHDFQYKKEISDFLINFGKHVVLNAIPVQSIDSKNCGKHCLVFCYVMSKNKSINQFKKWMKFKIFCCVDPNNVLSIKLADTNINLGKFEYILKVDSATYRHVFLIK